MKSIAGLLCVLSLAGAARAGDEAPGPCKQIAEACKSAGFAPGDWKKGDGLWKDCVDPIVRGKAQPANASKPLPTVDPATVAACKAKHPKYGEGKHPRK